MIERQSVIDLIVAEEGMGSGTVKYFIRRIRDLPFEERRTGHWIPVTNGRGGHECDICHEYAPSYQSGDEHLTKYCPNCGAKME